MENPKREGSIDENKIEGSDRLNQTSDEVSDESAAVGVSSRESETSCVSSSGPSITPRGIRRISGNERDLTERLRGIFRDEGDEDLLLQSTDRGNGILQWLQALDVQVMGGCRADERLKPLLKLNVSSGITDDSLLAHISQHFEVPEVGILARCLCIPLVTMRVGKVVKQGTLLFPTATRGNFYITLLPTSDLRISFAGDDGCSEKVVTLSSNSESSVVIEDIPADNSGRSFCIKLPDGKVLYFWCSEKSKLLGMELLAKMKDIVRRKPSLAQLTGISESRLDCFATHLRAYLIGSTVSTTQANANVSSSSVDTVSNSLELDQSTQLVPASTKPCRARYNSSQVAKTHALYQGSLSPRSNSFKDGFPRNVSLAKTVSREKIKRRGDGHLSVENLPVASKSAAQGCLVEVSGSQPLRPLGFLRSLGKPDSLPALTPLSSQIPSKSSSNYSPYYCWCPPRTSTLQCSATLPQLPIPLSDYSLSLPTLSSLSFDMSSPSPLFPPKSSVDVTGIISLDFPAFLPDPVNQLPLPVSSIISAASSQQIQTFTPLMCDPIVHILDVCSSGQGYLVTAGPLSTPVPSLHSNLVGPLITETESVVEKGARETLRLLISSTKTNPQLMGVIPVVLNSTDKKHGNLAVESRGLYSGIRDVGAIENTVGMVGLVSQQMVHCGEDDLDNISQVAEGPEKSCSDDGGAKTDWK
ncbi:uncharacterized protein LOC122071073 [Macadamia integrifolia]|uniref:uncharacterized protein LOC122071073 n=1 Tax=Macadamia integrifolia TaxID=60698 RepID=UPI001C4F7528|nr:uncharacterized protein LOC122071073 [Macadamia integrifolia]XP_042491279.1 uncharacterized protein LOC122071073 [Macadamia integrifolia]